jgi:tRNA-uridine 2-sulfurtransferase
MRIMVGMSGGVDSSVVAALLKQNGHEVIGVSMAIWDGPEDFVPLRHACYGPDEAEDINTARAICKQLHIPFSVVQCAEQYRLTIIKHFKEEYLAGRTPNPCIRCNQLFKFGILLDEIQHQGFSFDKFATGHYVRVEYNQAMQRYILRKGVDLPKDQSYFLFRLSQAQLNRVVFPLGDKTKAEVRTLAREFGLPVSEKPESQDFYGGDYQTLLGVEPKTGAIVDQQGKVLGEHQGYWNYTRGQRRGLGIAYAEPLYVIDVKPKTNQVVVGTRSQTFGTQFLVEDLNWISIPGCSQPMEVDIKIRSAQSPLPAIIRPIHKKEIVVESIQPLSAITPGQAAVFYDDDLLLGGGTISDHSP